MNRNYLPLVLIFLCSSVSAASFDCTTARTQVEKLVCKDETLSRLDSDLGNAYRLALNYATPADKPRMLSEQEQWLATVRDKCENVGCLVSAYAARIRALTLIETDGGAAEYVVDNQELADKLSTFERDLNSTGLPVKLSGCKLVVRLLDRSGAGRDQSYGAICPLGRRDILVCNDTMVGKLTIKFSGFAETPREVAEFTKTNCPPGG
jgi:uncharacterized protein